MALREYRKLTTSRTRAKQVFLFLQGRSSERFLFSRSCAITFLLSTDRSLLAVSVIRFLFFLLYWSVREWALVIGIQSVSYRLAVGDKWILSNSDEILKVYSYCFLWLQVPFPFRCILRAVFINFYSLLFMFYKISILKIFLIFHLV